MGLEPACVGSCVGLMDAIYVPTVVSSVYIILDTNKIIQVCRGIGCFCGCLYICADCGDFCVCDMFLVEGWGYMYTDRHMCMLCMYA